MLIYTDNHKFSFDYPTLAFFLVFPAMLSLPPLPFPEPATGTRDIPGPPANGAPVGYDDDGIGGGAAGPNPLAKLGTPLIGFAVEAGAGAAGARAAVAVCIAAEASSCVIFLVGGRWLILTPWKALQVTVMRQILHRLERRRLTPFSAMDLLGTTCDQALHVL